MIEHNLRLVAHIVKKYYTPNGDQDDLISIGTIGLIKGIGTFKPDKKVRLATYASRCIENEILMHFRAQRKTQGEVSLSDAIDGDGDGNSLSLMDTISVDDNMLEELDARDACAKVRGTANCKKRLIQYLEQAAEEYARKGIPFQAAAAGSFLNEADAQQWKTLCQELFPDQIPHYDPLTCSVGCHVGPGAFGMALARRLAP